MADESALIDALTKADAAGDTESAKQIASVIKMQRATGAPPPPPAAPTKTSQALGFEQGVGHFMSNMAGMGDTVGRTIGLPMDRIESTLFGGKTLKQAQDYISNPAHPADTAPGKIGRFAADVLETAPATAMMGPLAGGAVSGAMLSDQHTAGGIAKDAAIGGVAGKVGSALVGGLSRAIAPTVSPYVKTLMGSGVRVTPGQILGGTAQTIEDKAMSVPGVGDMIRNSRLRGLSDFNTAAINRSLAPIGDKVPDGVAGRDAVDYASKSLGDSYDKLLPQIQIKNDPQLQASVSQLTSLAQNIHQYGSKPLTDFINQEITPRFGKSGVMTGQSYKDVDSMLRQEAQSYSNSPLPNDRKVGQAFFQLRNNFKAAAERSNPTLAPQLKATDAGYANLVRIQNAANRPGADPGVFTPAQLSQAVRAGDNSVRKSSSARGNALMQGLSDAGKAVLPSRVPDSGTAGRMMGAGGVAALAGYAVSPGAAAPIAAGMGLYTKTGIKAAEYALARRPASATYASQLVKKLKGPTSIAATALGVSSSEEGGQ